MTPGLEAAARLAVLLDLFDEAYDRAAWHGPNLLGSVRRVSAADASWKPGKDRHSVHELVLHAAYWKYVVRRRLTGEKRGSFPLKGSNYFETPARLSDEAWRQSRELLASQHRALRAVVAAFPPERLAQKTPGSRYSNERTILGAAAHDIYHAGQIQLVKALRRGKGKAR
ncbi:MAG: DinB family protein [Acidobacteriota bacterium]